MLSQNYQHSFWQNNVCILKQIFQRAQKWYWNFRRPSTSQVIDQNSQNVVVINNSRTALPTYMLFLSSLDNLLLMHILFFKKVLTIIFWDRAQYMLIFGWGVASPKRLTTGKILKKRKKNRFLTCPCHKISVEVGLSFFNYTLKISIFHEYVKFWAI